MSIRASCARVSNTMVEAIKTDQSRFWAIPEMPWSLATPVDLQAQERLHLDKDWRTLSWLCSDTGRAEERYEAASARLDSSALTSGDFVSALTAKLTEMGFEYVPAAVLPADPVLTAIQGRRADDPGPTIDGLGLIATVFDPNEVSTLAAALDRLDESWVRSRFDTNEMKVIDLPGDHTLEELDQAILPQLARLKALYTRASQANQYVLVVVE